MARQFRTDQVGSLIRPPDLLRARAEHAEDSATVRPLGTKRSCPQCGFSTTSSGHPFTWDDQRRKLDLLVDTARKAWG